MEAEVRNANGEVGDLGSPLNNCDVVDESAVDMVLEMTVTVDSDGFQQASESIITRTEVRDCLQRCQGDISRAVDEVLSLVEIRKLSIEDERATQLRQDQKQQETQLQWHELCTSLGISECDAFMQALNNLPDDEKNEVLSKNGGFIQQLLLSMDAEDSSEDGDANEHNVHPIEKLQNMFPTYKLQVIEDVLEQNNYDVNAAAGALYNVRALNHVQSFAAVVSGQPNVSVQQEELVLSGPKFESLEQFPVLPGQSQQTKPQQTKNGHQQQQQANTKTRRKGRMATFFAQDTTPNAWEHHYYDHSLPVSNKLEARISTQLKIDRLKNLLPSIDRNIIQTTLLLNGCNSDATEAALRDIFNLPIVQKVKEEIVNDADEEEDTVEVQLDAFVPKEDEDEWTYVKSRRRVETSRQTLSDRYCAVLDSFRRGHHVIAEDRVRELSRARRDLRDAQRESAHQYFLAHKENLHRRQAIDLHGLIVMEALQVGREAIEYCQQQRIQRCIFVCGVGYHSIKGKPRILTAMQLSLDHRHIDYRENRGVLTVFPLRSA